MFWKNHPEHPSRTVYLWKFLMGKNRGNSKKPLQPTKELNIINNEYVFYYFWPKTEHTSPSSIWRLYIFSVLSPDFINFCCRLCSLSHSFSRLRKTINILYNNFYLISELQTWKRRWKLFTVIWNHVP